MRNCEYLKAAGMEDRPIFSEMTLACRSDPVPMLVTGAIVGAGVEKKLEKPRMSRDALGAD